MKNLFVTALLTLSLNTMAASATYFSLGGTTGQSDEISEQITQGMITTTSPALTTTSGSVVAGVVFLADGSTTALDFNNEYLLEEIEIIQVAIEEKAPLSEMQRTILAIGYSSDQLDQYGNILTE